MRIGGLQQLFVIIFTVGIRIFFGYICKAISKSRGIPGGFWWGFFLGIIGIIVVAVRPNGNNVENTERRDNTISTYDELERIKKLLDSGVITQEEFDTIKQRILYK